MLELTFISKLLAVTNLFKLFEFLFLRGGIPLCFPVFGPWENGKPQHWLARNSNDWVVKEQMIDENGDANVK